MSILLFLGLFNSSAHAFTYYDYIHLIEEKKPTTIYEALAILPESIRSNYILQHTSKGLQGASTEDPRVFLFEQDTSFVATFNNNPKHGNHDSIEVIQYNRQQKEFEFYELNYKNGPISKRPEKNPAHCMACHGSQNEAHPNFEFYPRWPGFFGSYDDVVNGDNDEKKALIAFNQKIKSQKASPSDTHRYSVLVNDQPLYQAGTDDLYPSRDEYIERIVIRADTYRRPLARFETGLILLNNDRLYPKIIKSEGYSKFLSLFVLLRLFNEDYRLTDYNLDKMKIERDAFLQKLEALEQQDPRAKLLLSKINDLLKTNFPSLERMAWSPHLPDSTVLTPLTYCNLFGINQNHALMISEADSKTSDRYRHPFEEYRLDLFNFFVKDYNRIHPSTPISYMGAYSDLETAIHQRVLKNYQKLTPVMRFSLENDLNYFRSVYEPANAILILDRIKSLDFVYEQVLNDLDIH